MNIQYHHVSEFPGWSLSGNFLIDLIKVYQPQKVLEIGSGANPTLNEQDVLTLGVEYTTNDLSAEELKKAPPIFLTWEADLCTPNIAENHVERYQLIFSRMVNEHVKDGKSYYKNLYDLLEPGGVTAHCFSTLYAFPFLVNRILPENLTDKLLNFFNPREDRYQHEKFPAYYSWSRGPSAKIIKKFEGLGFEVIEYAGFFGHGYYRKKVPFLDYLEQKKAHWLVKNPISALTSYAYIVLKKRS